MVSHRIDYSPNGLPHASHQTVEPALHLALAHTRHLGHHDDARLKMIRVMVSPTLKTTFSPSLATMVCAVLVTLPSPSSSISSLAIESKSLVRCLATIRGWLPLDKMSNKSADEEK